MAPRRRNSPAGLLAAVIFHGIYLGRSHMHDRKIYDSNHAMFRDSARRFFKEEVEANIAQWEKDGIVPRSFWQKAGAQGFLCCGIDRKSVVSGKSVSVRVDLGGRRIIKKKKRLQDK